VMVAVGVEQNLKRHPEITGCLLGICAFASAMSLLCVAKCAEIYPDQAPRA
jgi:hypothetical protein